MIQEPFNAAMKEPSGDKASLPTPEFTAARSEAREAFASKSYGEPDVPSFSIRSKTNARVVVVNDFTEPSFITAKKTI